MGSMTLRSTLFLLMALVATPTLAGEEAHIVGTATIVDGDTIDVGPVRIRLHGIDAPEAGQRCGKANGGTWPCGDEAIGRLADLVEGKRKSSASPSLPGERGVLLPPLPAPTREADDHLRPRW
jgi:endonuclease YncB( thermonuclease family)